MSEESGSRVPPFPFAPGGWAEGRYWTIGSKASMEPLQAFDVQENRIRVATLADFVAEVDLLQRGLAVLLDPFLPGTLMAYPESAGVEEPASYHAYQFNLMMLANSLRIYKSAVDLALDGHYSSSFALCRVILESWKKILFVRRSPSLVYRFIPISWVDKETLDRVGRKEFNRPPSRGEWDRAVPVDAVEGTTDEADRRYLDAVREGIDYLHHHSHPTLESATQLMASEGGKLLPGQLSIYPSFSAEHARRCFSMLHKACFLLMREERISFHRESDWLERADQWKRDWSELMIFTKSNDRRDDGE